MFNEKDVIKLLKHYLPSQAPLKDFVHHNTLHAFQKSDFFEAIQTASRLFGYKVSLSIEEYRELYKNHKIREDILEYVIIKNVGEKDADEFIFNLFHKTYDDSNPQRIGMLRAKWKKKLNIDFDTEVHSKLFKFVSSYLDQGISIWNFPHYNKGFLDSLRDLEENSFFHILKTKRARQLFKDKNTTITNLLEIIVGDEDLYERYLFDQQFAHPGWSGMVSTIEDNPSTLLDQRAITFHDFVFLELILEIDILESHYGSDWKSLHLQISAALAVLFPNIPYKPSAEDKVISIWQEAFEWSYYDEVLAGIKKMKGKTFKKSSKSFQALFCIDDREGSIRRHIENFDQHCETYGTPGHFGIEFYFQPKNGKFHTKVCPGPITPKYLIKEISDNTPNKRDIHFSKSTHQPFIGSLLTISLGFLSAWKLIVNIFNPKASPGASSSFSHMGENSTLTIENKSLDAKQDGLQIGFTIDEMTTRVEAVLKSIGLIDDFGTLIYSIGHGSSSINNTHYAGYDCGACSGRPGSVNARVFAYMANHKEVRSKLKEKGIDIPEKTQFIGGLHDTSRDEFSFYDEDYLSKENLDSHKENIETFKKALDLNAKERSRRFALLNSKDTPKNVHQKVINRSVSLFEPRPELNHATNSLCIVGRHSLNEKLFLDRRAFSNSYDYSIDPKGELLSGILNAASPVCAGINLEYYFSRVDNQKFGAGSKLPHNVMGLIGVSNGVEGDLRPGLPLQMIEVHDPVRLLMIVEHYPDVVLESIKRNDKTYELFNNGWLNLVAVDPDTYEIYKFDKGEFKIYDPLKHLLDTVYDINPIIESESGNLPVYLIKK